MSSIALRKSPELSRFLRFLVVGALGTLIDFGLLTVLKLSGLPTLTANSLSFMAGMTNNFVLNRRWTFADLPRARWTKQFAQFALVSLAGLALNNAIVLLLETPLGVLLGLPAWGCLLAKVVATGIVVLWNYLANRFWTFRPSSAEFDGI